MYEQAYAELYEQLIASGYAEETLNELTTRAEEAGDEGAATLAESIRSSLASLSETAPEPSAGMVWGLAGKPQQQLLKLQKLLRMCRKYPNPGSLY